MLYCKYVMIYRSPYFCFWEKKKTSAVAEVGPNGRSVLSEKAVEMAEEAVRRGKEVEQQQEQESSSFSAVRRNALGWDRCDSLSPNYPVLSQQSQSQFDCVVPVVYCVVGLLLLFWSSMLSISPLPREESGRGTFDACAIFVRGAKEAGAGEIFVTEMFLTSTARSYLLEQLTGLDWSVRVT